MVYIQRAHYVGDYKIRIIFDSGEEGVVDLCRFIKKHPKAEPLLDKNHFSQFYLDEWPTLVWPCGFDVAPEMLYEMVTGKAPSWFNSGMVHETQVAYTGSHE